LASKIHRPYLSRAWAIVVMSKSLVGLFQSKGINTSSDIELLESTFEKAIALFKLANTSYTGTTKYELSSYDAQPVISDFKVLEDEIKRWYTTLKAGDQWATSERLLNDAIAKDKDRVKEMNKRFDSDVATQHSIQDDNLITVTIKSSIAGVSQTTMRVSGTTRLSAIRYDLSRKVTVVEERTKIVSSDKFQSRSGVHALDQDIQTICGGAKTLDLRFL